MIKMRHRSPTLALALLYGMPGASSPAPEDLHEVLIFDILRNGKLTYLPRLCLAQRLPPGRGTADCLDHRKIAPWGMVHSWSCNENATIPALP